MTRQQLYRTPCCATIQELTKEQEEEGQKKIVPEHIGPLGEINLHAARAVQRGSRSEASASIFWVSRGSVGWKFLQLP